jgi:hypothetical protein
VKPVFRQTDVQFGVDEERRQVNWTHDLCGYGGLVDVPEDLTPEEVKGDILRGHGYGVCVPG